VRCRGKRSAERKWNFKRRRIFSTTRAQFAIRDSAAERKRGFASSLSFCFFFFSEGREIPKVLLDYPGVARREDRTRLAPVKVNLRKRNGPNCETRCGIRSVKTCNLKLSGRRSLTRSFVCRFLKRHSLSRRLLCEGASEAMRIPESKRRAGGGGGGRRKKRKEEKKRKRREEFCT